MLNFNGKSYLGSQGDAKQGGEKVLRGGKSARNRADPNKISRIFEITQKDIYTNKPQNFRACGALKVIYILLWYVRSIRAISKRRRRNFYAF